MIAIIPARSGSKGLPNKNIKPLNGIPLIAHTILCAQRAKSINQIIISTDSKIIADICLEYGADVPFLRPEHLSTDQSHAIDAYIYTIEQLEKQLNNAIDNFIVLQPTSPLRRPEDIDKAIELFFKMSADSVISYTKEHHPIYWHKNICKDLRFENIFPEVIKNRQELRETFFPNGSIYIYKTEIIKQRRHYTNNSYAYIMPRNLSIDIDTIDDFEFAEYILQKEESLSSCEQ